MSPYQTARFFLLAAGLCVVALLLTPAVHASVIIIHGPMTALRSFQFAAIFRWLMRAMLLFGVLVPPLQMLRRVAFELFAFNAASLPSTQTSPLRC